MSSATTLAELQPLTFYFANVDRPGFARRVEHVAYPEGIPPLDPATAVGAVFGRKVPWRTAIAALRHLADQIEFNLLAGPADDLDDSDTWSGSGGPA
jgi:hypothetical protein